MVRKAIFVTVAVFFLLNVSIIYAEHLEEFSWMNGIKGRGNQSCCGVQDCVEATVVVLEEDVSETVVMIGETVLALPTSWVHESKGHTGIWCFVPQSASDGSARAYVDALGRIRAFPPEIPTRDNTRCAFFLTFN
jgi:hypothetical protein